MRILHYCLGFPPYRTGGMPQYCLDLMIQQRKDGHEAGMLWPGSMGLRRGKIRIKSGRKTLGIDSFELMNPLPVALDEGIAETKSYMEPGEIKVFMAFLKNWEPDAIHFHTFMGIYKEFLEAAKELSIPMIYTTHDFYGLCPKVTFFHNGELCTEDHGCLDCVQCNRTALSLRKIRLMQSPVYRLIKNTDIIKKLRQKHRADFFKGNSMAPVPAVSAHTEEKKKYEYQELRKYYMSMFRMIDKMHYNSTVTEAVFKKYFDSVPGSVISITNGSIQDNKRVKKASKQVRIAFLGAPNPVKGYGLLVGALDELWQEGYRNFELHSYGSGQKQERYLQSHPRYQRTELGHIMENTDIVAVPSCWFETFGFVALEALSYGVPVLISERVGAKDIIKDGRTGFIVSPNVQSLKERIRSILDSQNGTFEAMNRCIVKEQKIKTIDIHAKEIEELYER